MPKQSVTIELEVPDGYEVCECGPYHPSVEFNLNGWSSFVLAKIMMRPAADPVEEWLERLENWWLADGWWVYETRMGWFLAAEKPSHGCDSVDADSLAALYGCTFTPPPVDCLQVKRAAAPAPTGDRDE